MTQSSDAKQIARRIVREVVEDRGGVVPAAVPEHAEAEGPSAASGRAVQRPIDPEARAAARRIVEEVLASSTPVPVDAPSAPTSTVPDTDPSGAESAATPVSAAPAVVEPAPPSTPSARIARRIVDAVVAEHAARTTPPAGPPPPPGPEERARRTGAQEPVTVPGPGDGAAEPADRAGSVPSPQPAIEVSPPPAAGVATGALETPAAETARRILDEVLAEHERTLQEAPPTSPDTPALDDGGDADGDDEPGDGLDESAGDDAVTAALFPAAEADPGPAHAPEGPDDPATPSSTTDALFVAAPSDGAQERTAARLVADTLEPPAVAEPGPVTAGAEHDATHAGDGSYEPDEATPDEVTVDGSHAPDEVTAQAHWPQDTPPRRTGRWLVVTIVGAVALAYLFPMAVGAFRELVSLS